MSRITEYAGYFAAGLLGVICYVLFDVFWLPILPFFIFIFQLRVSYRLGAFHALPVMLFALQIGLIIWLEPTSYVFTFLYLFAVVVYWLGKMKHGVLWQNAVYAFWLVVIGLKPGYLLLLAMKYQRVLNVFSDMVV